MQAPVRRWAETITLERHRPTHLFFPPDHFTRLDPRLQGLPSRPEPAPRGRRAALSRSRTALIRPGPSSRRSRHAFRMQRETDLFLPVTVPAA